MNEMEIAEWAEKIAEGLPEKYQVVAFDRLLQHGLNDHNGAEGVTFRKADEVKTAQENKHAAEWLLEVLENMPAAHSAAAGSRRQQAAWAVLELQKTGQDATVEAVRKVIKETLGITPENPKHSSNTLRDLTPKYLSRKKAGRAYIYEATRFVNEVFAEENKS